MGEWGGDEGGSITVGFSNRAQCFEISRQERDEPGKEYMYLR